MTLQYICTLDFTLVYRDIHKLYNYMSQQCEKFTNENQLPCYDYLFSKSQMRLRV